MTGRQCPTCGASVGAPDVSAHFPFCSERCKLVDLGNWLGERYRVPAAETDDEPDGASDDSSGGDGGPGESRRGAH